MVERRWAYALLRLIAGINFLGHGLFRILHGVGEFAGGMAKGFAGTPMPVGFALGFGYCIPWIELTIGVLLIAGVFTRWALVGAMLLMAALMLGVTAKQDWATAGTQLGYGLVLFVLLFLRAEYEVSWMKLATER